MQSNAYFLNRTILQTGMYKNNYEKRIREAKYVVFYSCPGGEKIVPRHEARADDKTPKPQVNPHAGKTSWYAAGCWAMSTVISAESFAVAVRLTLKISIFTKSFYPIKIFPR
jgi:hypothetical protein